MKGQERINEILAYIIVDPKDDTEGIPALLSDDGWLPALGADRERVESLKDQIQWLANATGTTIELVRFSVREHLETIQPK